MTVQHKCYQRALGAWIVGVNMNEQFKAIAVEAKIQMVSEPRLQEFAELLIKNNIHILINNGYDDAAKCLHDVHFGIDDAP
jgi:hypothetical protein